MYRITVIEILATCADIGAYIRSEQILKLDERKKTITPNCLFTLVK